MKIAAKLEKLAKRFKIKKPVHQIGHKIIKTAKTKRAFSSPALSSSNLPNLNSNFKGRSIISINDLQKEDIIHILETAKKIEAMPEEKRKRLMEGKVMASLFFEPSTRTRLSFESAMRRTGGRTIGFSDASATSFAKGETLFDTSKMIEHYADVIVMRHPREGSARLVSDAVRIPVINGGDGSNQHPTQTLLDLYTIKKVQGRITNLNIAMVGDLKYGRTVHSLTVALSKFNCIFYFVAPKELQMPPHYLAELERLGIKYSLHEKIEEVIDNVDILYMTRIQKERFPDPAEYEKVKNVYILRKSMLKNARPNMKILHPLPRVNEIAKDVDDTEYAYYFQQAYNGVPIRQAVLCLVAGVLK